MGLEQPIDLSVVNRTVRGTSGPGGVDVSRVDEQMLVLINQARADGGLEPLVSHPALRQAAGVHAQDMATYNQLSHFGLTSSSTWADRALAAGYPGASLSTIGEDVGAGQTSAEMLMGDYKQSPGHWAAIMNPKARHTGSAAATGSGGWTYWCTDFGSSATDSLPLLGAEDVVRG